MEKKKKKERMYKLLQKEDTEVKGNRKNNYVYEGIQSLGHVPNSFWPHELPGSSVPYVYEEMITNVIENILN